MSQASRVRPVRPHFRVTNDHPLENGLAVFTLVVGLVAFATGWMRSLHVVASWAGLAALLVGLYSQLISATRAERMVIVTGLVAAFVGLALGLAHGAFLP